MIDSSSTRSRCVPSASARAGVPRGLAHSARERRQGIESGYRLEVVGCGESPGFQATWPASVRATAVPPASKSP